MCAVVVPKIGNLGIFSQFRDAASVRLGSIGFSSSPTHSLTPNSVSLIAQYLWQIVTRSYSNTTYIFISPNHTGFCKFSNWRHRLEYELNGDLKAWNGSYFRVLLQLVYWHIMNINHTRTNCAFCASNGPSNLLGDTLYCVLGLELLSDSSLRGRMSSFTKAMEL